MSVPELVDYIRTQTQEGVPAEDLRFTLLESGWQETDIENALHDVAAGLNPATPGASIHEDLAQVRGMVAHLAGRVKGLEARLASLVPGTKPLPVTAQLPSQFIGPDHELTGRRHGGAAHLLSLVAAVVGAAALGYFGTGIVEQNNLAPRAHIIGAAALGACLILAGVVAMRRGRGWAASVCVALGLTLWITDTFVSWRVYHYLEWSVALGLGILFVVIALVIGRWIVRLSR